MIESFFQSIVTAIGTWPAIAIFVILGIALLKYGADWLVDGAANLGFRLGISAAMIGLTVIAFGTSAPELVVSVVTAINGKPEICLGNVVGSNIANTSLVLGATAMVFPLQIQRVTLRQDAPMSMLTALLILVMAFAGLQISRLDGILLLLVFTGWMIWLGRETLVARKGALNEVVGEAEEHHHDRPAWQDLVLIAVGLFCLVMGGDSLVSGSVEAARTMNVFEIVVGLTIVAGGTSLPELAVCLVAAFKRHAEMTVGNVLGSNIFNALLILGTAAAIAPISFSSGSFGWRDDPGTLWLDMPAMVLICAMVLPIMAHNRTLTRIKGAMLVAYYVFYVGFLVWRNTAH